MVQGLELLQELNDQTSIAAAINKQAQMCIYQDNYEKAGLLLNENLLRRRALGDKRGIFSSLNNLAVHLYHNNREYAAAATLLEEALVVLEEIGDRLGKIIALENLAIIAYYQQSYPQARQLLHQSLYLCRELDINNYAFQATGVLVGVLIAEKQYCDAVRLIGGLTTAQKDKGMRLEAPEDQIYQTALQTLGDWWDKMDLESELQLGLKMSWGETIDSIL